MTTETGEPRQGSQPPRSTLRCRAPCPLAASLSGMRIGVCSVFASFPDERDEALRQIPCAELTAVSIFANLITWRTPSSTSTNACSTRSSRGRSVFWRTLYCFVIGQRVVVLHAFVKKTRAAPKSDLAIARRRMKEVSDAQD